MSYLCHTTNLTLQGTVSQTDESCVLEVFTDADFAACPYSAKSTSGVLFMLRTGDCQYPLHWMSKKQSSIARSTTEAEMIALATAMFSEAENLQGHLEEISRDRSTSPVPAGQRDSTGNPQDGLLSKAEAPEQSASRKRSFHL